MEQEPLTKAQVSMIRQAAGIGGMVFDWNIDYAVGAGIVGSNEKCIWTKDGRRISCSLLSHGGWIISQGKAPDPLYAELERKF